MADESSIDVDRLGVFLDLRGRRVLVVGGGRVGQRRVSALLAAGARVTLLSPGVTDHLARLDTDGEILWEQREYRSSELIGQVMHPPRYWLVHTATGTVVDSVVARDAEKAGIWCIRADSGADSAAIVGARAKGPDDIQIAVTSGDPRRSSRIAGSVSQALSVGDLPIRRTRSESRTGWVALIGGGPGEPGLLTLRGRQLLAMADVVVTDRLGPISVLTELEDDVRIVDVGKSPGYHPVPQTEINEILVVEAKAGNRVVRLKGGDPFVLGRGAEEAQFCQEHDVPVEWVPGVTSAVSVPAAAGIPVTHRATSPAFIVASGHESPEAAAATPPGTTVLLLMGVLHLEETARLLLNNGRGPDTPVAIVEKGWTPAQRTTRTDLGSCALAVAERNIRPPAVVVVGPAAALADVLGPVSPVVPR